MRFLITILILMTASTGCENLDNHTPYIREVSSKYYEGNEDKFGFFVFDKQKVDAFLQQYTPLSLDNRKLADSLKALRKLDAAIKPVDSRFSSHIEPSTYSDHELAESILGTIDKPDGQIHFVAAMHYRFFYECLPEEFRYRWVETISGDFQFNVTFFNLLRVKCPEFDKHIYREIFYWDNQMETIFPGGNYNEIASEKAKLIRDCILRETAFDDVRMKTDKDNFIFFLDNVIANKWRMLIDDKN